MNSRINKRINSSLPINHPTPADQLFTLKRVSLLMTITFKLMKTSSMLTLLISMLMSLFFIGIAKAQESPTNTKTSDGGYVVSQKKEDIFTLISEAIITPNIEDILSFDFDDLTDNPKYTFANTGLNMTRRFTNTWTAFSTNTGNITLSNFRMEGGNAPGDFAVENSTCTNVPPGGSCQWVIKFTPTAQGTRSTVLKFTPNSNTTPDTLPLEGTSNTIVHSSWGFGPTPVNQSVDYRIDWAMPTNNWSFENFNFLGTNAANFSITSHNCTNKAANQICSIYFRFLPTSGGQKNASLHYNYTYSQGNYRTGENAVRVISAQATCTYNLSSPGLNISSNSLTSNFTVTTNGSGCPWTAVSNVPWIRTTSSGNTNGTVNYTLDANLDGTSRTGIISVGDKTFTIIQAGINCTYTVSPAIIPATAVSSNGFIGLTTEPGCAWTATSDSPDWLRISPPNGMGDRLNIAYSITANNTPSPRTGRLTIGGRTVTVTQEGAAVPCTVELNPTSKIIEAAAGSHGFTVITSAAACSWTATTTTPWIHLTNSGGTNNGAVTFNADENTGAASRVGTITVGNQVFTVNQNNAANTTYSIKGKVTNRDNGSPVGQVTLSLYGPVSQTAVTDDFGNYQFTGLPSFGETGRSGYFITPTKPGASFNPGNLLVPVNNADVANINFELAVCSYRLSDVYKDMPAAGAVGNFGVLSACSWTATSNVPWIVITRDNAGTGNETMSFYVQRNYGANRSGTITVEGQIFTVVQSGFSAAADEISENANVAECDVNFTAPNSPSQKRLAVPPAGSASLSFNINTGCQWDALVEGSGARWVKLSGAQGTPSTVSGSGDKTLAFSVEKNSGAFPRIATVHVNGAVFTVVQPADSKEQICSNLALGSPNGNYSSSGGVQSLDINGVTNDCKWIARVFNSALTDPDRLILAPKTELKGSGSGALNFTLDANKGPVERSGTIFVKDKAFMVNQAASTQGTASCVYQISSAGQSIGKDGRAESFNISSAQGCPWNAVTVDSWITINGGSGSGSGTVNYTVAPNPGAARTGKIAVGGKEYTITQSSATENCNYVISPGFQIVDAIGAAGVIRVTAVGSGCATVQANVLNNSNWINTNSNTVTITAGAEAQVNFIVQTNNTTTERVGSIVINGQIFTITQAAGSVQSNKTAAFDYDGDGKSDASVFRPADGVWHLMRSRDGYTGFQFGSSSDKPVAADYDGDGKTDAAVYRAGVWHLMRSRDGYTGFGFGIPTDKPVPADYDGDGKADAAVYRDGVWHILGSTSGYRGVQFGNPSDRPVPADYDGDGKADMAVYRDGVWHIQQSAQGYKAYSFGVAADKPVAGDYDGDRKADPAVYRQGVWHILRSTQGYTGFGFGIANDLPVPADYDGDGKTDAAVYRSGSWFILNSTNGFSAFGFGNAADKPVANSFVP